MSVSILDRRCRIRSFSTTRFVPFGATFSRSDVVVWISKSRFTYPTFIKIGAEKRTVRSFGRRAFYTSTLRNISDLQYERKYGCARVPTGYRSRRSAGSAKNSLRRYRHDFSAAGTANYPAPYKRHYCAAHRELFIILNRTIRFGGTGSLKCLKYSCTLK